VLNLTFTLKEDGKIKVIEGKQLRNIFRPKREKVIRAEKITLKRT
jgi:hypothetical protein